LNPITPKSIRVKLMTVASTGLLSESSDIFTDEKCILKLVVGDKVSI